MLNPRSSPPSADGAVAPRRDNANAIYAELDDRVRATVGGAFGFTAHVATRPVTPSNLETSQLASQFPIIKRFQETCLELFFESLEDPDHWLSDCLLRDVTPSFARSFHEALPSMLRHTPRFFRTDQPTYGCIAEIQCPGSGWGECSLLEAYFRKHALMSRTAGIEQAFNSALRTVVPREPVVCHLVDNASSLVSNLYFIAATRRAHGGPRYQGVDLDIAPQDCNFIRTHLFEGLLTENFGRPRLIRGQAGELQFDYPPLCIFEQKALLALPFHPETRNRFTDDIRHLLLWSGIIKPDGVELPDGARLTLAEFTALPRRQRPFFIKYAGIDSALNWGSRAVYYAGDFTTLRLERLLSQIVDGYESGRGCWIIQSSASARSDVTFCSREGSVVADSAYQKISGFYGPSGLLGAVAMYRPTKKVHGQVDTIMAPIDLRGQGRSESCA